MDDPSNSNTRGNKRRQIGQTSKPPGKRLYRVGRRPNLKFSDTPLLQVDHQETPLIHQHADPVTGVARGHFFNCHNIAKEIGEYDIASSYQIFHIRKGEYCYSVLALSCFHVDESSQVINPPVSKVAKRLQFHLLNKTDEMGNEEHPLVASATNLSAKVPDITSSISLSKKPTEYSEMQTIVDHSSATSTDISVLCNIKKEKVDSNVLAETKEFQASKSLQTKSQSDSDDEHQGKESQLSKRRCTGKQKMLG